MVPTMPRDVVEAVEAVLPALITAMAMTAVTDEQHQRMADGEEKADRRPAACPPASACA